MEPEVFLWESDDATGRDRETWAGRSPSRASASSPTQRANRAAPGWRGGETQPELVGGRGALKAEV